MFDVPLQPRQKYAIFHIFFANLQMPVVQICVVRELERSALEHFVEQGMQQNVSRRNKYFEKYRRKMRRFEKNVGIQKD